MFLTGYFFLKVFISISLVLGDGLYNLIKIIVITTKEFCNKYSKQKNLIVVTEVLGECISGDFSC